MSYMLYALGYRIGAGDYTYYMAADYARSIGVCVTEKDEPLTRAGAVEAMYQHTPHYDKRRGQSLFGRSR